MIAGWNSVEDQKRYWLSSLSAFILSCMSLLGKIFCSIATLAVLYVVNRLMTWAIETQGFGTGIEMGISIFIAVYAPWLFVWLRRIR